METSSRRSRKASFEPPARSFAFFRRTAEIVDRLNSNDFDVFFPLFSAKDNGAVARSLVSWAKRSELASTAWFAERIREALG